MATTADEIRDEMRETTERLMQDAACDAARGVFRAVCSAITFVQYASGLNRERVTEVADELRALVDLLDEVAPKLPPRPEKQEATEAPTADEVPL